MKIFVLLILVITSCTPAQRLGRLVKNHPELVSTDTVFKQDTTIIEAVKQDSTFIFTGRTDTFYMEKDRLKIKVIRSHDTLTVQGECKTDTIIKQIPVQVNTTNPVFIQRMKLKQWLFVILIVAAVIGCIMIFRKR